MHLDARSWYSFHDGVSSPAALCAQAAELGFDTLGLCDVDGIYGLISFYKAALKCGLKPLLGLSLTDPAAGMSPQRKGGGTDGHGDPSYPAYLDGSKPLPPGSKGAPYGRK